MLHIVPNQQTGKFIVHRGGLVLAEFDTHENAQAFIDKVTGKKAPTPAQ